jgi:hypothetical protein
LLRGDIAAVTAVKNLLSAECPGSSFSFFSDASSLRELPAIQARGRLSLETL